MININSFSISLSYDFLLLFLGIFILIGLSALMYRFTVPNISGIKKFVLVLLRSVALVSILFLIFDPVLNSSTTETKAPKTFVFVDNSQSVTILDSLKNSQSVNRILDQVKSGISSNEIFSFGDSVRSLESTPYFKDAITNLDEVAKFLAAQGETAANAVIITDGQINNGSASAADFEKIGIPVFTIGIGDTIASKDLELKNIEYNKILYSGSPTTIEAAILNTGFAGQNVAATLYENSSPLISKNIELTDGGITRVTFNYTPESPGERQLQIQVSGLPGEQTTANNSKRFFINVLKSKLHVTLLADQPSTDVKFITAALTNNPDIVLHSVVQLTNHSLVKGMDNVDFVDSADVIILYGVPSAMVPNNYLEKVKKSLADDKPFIFIISPDTDLKLLNSFTNKLPFTSNDFDGKIIPSTLNITNNLSSLLKIDNTVASQIWSSLPPYSGYEARFNPKPGAEVIAEGIMRNTNFRNPAIISRTVGSQRSIAVLGFNLWRWKLQSAEKNINLFDQFINNCVKWLSIDPKRERFLLNLDKKVFAYGEPVNIAAELYDESFSPVGNAEVKLTISSGEDSREYFMNAEENGRYKTVINGLPPSNYSITAVAGLNGNQLASTTSIFTVAQFALEVPGVLNKELLTGIAKQTGGKYAYGNSAVSFWNEIQMINVSNRKDVPVNSEFKFLPNEWILLVIIFILGCEWFIRKRSGMI